MVMPGSARRLQRPIDSSVAPPPTRAPPLPARPAAPSLQPRHAAAIDRQRSRCYCHWNRSCWRPRVPCCSKRATGLRDGRPRGRRGSGTTRQRRVRWLRPLRMLRLLRELSLRSVHPLLPVRSPQWAWVLRWRIWLQWRPCCVRTAWRRSRATQASRRRRQRQRREWRQRRQHWRTTRPMHGGECWTSLAGRAVAAAAAESGARRATRLGLRSWTMPDAVRASARGRLLSGVVCVEAQGQRVSECWAAWRGLVGGGGARPQWPPAAPSLLALARSTVAMRSTIDGIALCRCCPLLLPRPVTAAAGRWTAVARRADWAAAAARHRRGRTRRVEHCVRARHSSGHSTAQSRQPCASHSSVRRLKRLEAASAHAQQPSRYNHCTAVGTSDGRQSAGMSRCSLKHLWSWSQTRSSQSDNLCIAA